MLLTQLQQTEKTQFKLSQRRRFKMELDALSKEKEIRKSNQQPLQLYLDSDGLMLVGGRLEKADFSVSRKHSIILHCKDHLVELPCTSIHIM